MTFVIQHPGRDDLFSDGQKEWVPLSGAQDYASPELAAYFAEFSDRIISRPEKEPIHPLSHTP